MNTGNQDQIEYWNGVTGQKWATKAALLDQMLQPFAQTVLHKAAVGVGDRCLDIGCGAGALTLTMAEATGASGKVLGLDVSEPLIQLAQTRAKAQNSKATFQITDAAAYHAPQPFDKILSRFGVMFFSQPIEAFSMLRKTLRKTGTLNFACWQDLPHNEWAFAPLQIALPFLKEPPTPPTPHSPGPFAFGDKAYLQTVLEQSGWDNVIIEDVKKNITLPGRTPQEAAEFMLELGPVSRLLREQDLDLAPVHAALAQKLAKHESKNNKICLSSAIWLVSATA